MKKNSRINTEHNGKGGDEGVMREKVDLNEKKRKK